jgi:Kef-type K+ transport system membrane component KefB
MVEVAPMENVWVLAAVWVGLALIATLVAIWFRISTALSEIVVGTVAQLVIGALFVHAELGGKTSWISFLAGTGAIVLTFLAGAELDPQIFRTKWKEATVVGLVGFFGPFFGCTAVAHYILHWSGRSSWLAGVALSTTFVAVVYAVMLELGFNVTDFGKAVLAACFINDLGTVIALGLIFSPFTLKTLVFIGVSVVVFAVLPFLTPRFFKKYGGRVSELEAQRSGLASLHNRHGPGGNRGKGPQSHKASSHPDLRIAHAVLLHSGGVVCIRACSNRGTARIYCVVLRQDAVESNSSVPHGEGL